MESLILFRRSAFRGLFFKLLFLGLACNYAPFPATVVDAHSLRRIDHRLDRTRERLDDDGLWHYGCADPFKCKMGPGPAPATAPSTFEPPSFEGDMVPWYIHYMNVSNNYESMAASPDGLHVNLSITNDHIVSGRMYSKNMFLFGYFSMKMKLVPNESAGVISTFYLISSDFDTRDEIDFEFLGNTTGNPITLQTNVYMDGAGFRAQQHYLPFDPAADFHEYSLLWNQHLIIWFVDDKVIRVFHNKSNEIATHYPMSKPMQVQATIWTELNQTNDWATQGGRVHIDFAYAPFVAQYEGFGGVDGCPVCAATPPTACNNLSVCSDASKYWFQQQEYLTEEQVNQLKDHRQNHVISDYCRRSEGAPEECPYNSFGT
ncbi:hypothetical protein M758_UG132600 [Ceratodon purpureus]|nr:hypothetical protein M758_UG132600 [Ceratodon purpureus]